MTTNENGFTSDSRVEDVALVSRSGPPIEEPSIETIRVTHSTHKSSFDDIRQMVVQEFLDAPIMVHVANAESGFDPAADNPNSTAYGVFQILIGTWNDYGCTGDRGNATDNIECARKIYDARGTKDWDASKNKWGIYL